jgi:hypothetical protein
VYGGFGDVGCAIRLTNITLSFLLRSKPLFSVSSATKSKNSPLNLCEKGPYGNKYENFRHYRYVEVKHGRKCGMVEE